jgi:FMN phosphatase YigB (HAD superfamily)
MRALSCEPDQLLFVGDDLEADIAGSEAVGMTPVLVDVDDKHKDARCIRIRRVAELRKLLR